MVTARKRNGDTNRMSEPTGTNGDYAGKSGRGYFSPGNVRLFQLFNDIRTEWTRHSRFGVEGSLRAASEKARELESLIQKEMGPHPTTLPIGVLTSKESGLIAVTPGNVSQILDRDPNAELFGYINLPESNARHAANAYEHMHKLEAVANNRQADTKYPELDIIVRNPVHTPNAVVGPLEISKHRYALFLEWVIGPLVHEQLDLSYPRGNITELQRANLAHQTMLATAHLIGAWQANPYPSDLERPKNIDETVRRHYIDSGVSSIKTLVDVLGLDVGKERLAAVEKHFADLITSGSFKLNPDPITGNIAVYGDWNIRNVVQRINARKAQPTVADVFNTVYRNGSIDFAKLLESLTKIDLNNPDVRWVVDADEIAHLVRNVNAPQDPTLVSVYSGASTLVRQAFRYFLDNERNNSGKYGPQLRNARELAEAYQALRDGAAAPNEVRVTPQEIPALKKHVAEYSGTTTTVHFLRVLRQAALAAGQYLPRTLAVSQMSDAVKEQDIESVALEADLYLKRAADQHEAVVVASGITSRSSRYEAAMTTRDLLTEIRDSMRKREYDTSKLVEIGAGNLAGFS